MDNELRLCRRRHSNGSNMATDNGSTAMERGGDTTTKEKGIGKMGPATIPAQAGMKLRKFIGKGSKHRGRIGLLARDKARGLSRQDTGGRTDNGRAFVLRVVSPDTMLRAVLRVFPLLRVRVKVRVRETRSATSAVRAAATTSPRDACGTGPPIPRTPASFMRSG